MPTRRQALKSFAAVGSVALATGLYTWQVEPHWLEFTFPALPVSGLPRELEGRTLAQISDTHFGPRVDDAYILDSFRRVKQLAPDFVIYTGDWITYRSARELQHLQRISAELPHGRIGTIGVLGNHDYGFDWSMLDVANRVSAIVRNAGVTLLRNEAVTISGLQFVGLEDLWSPVFDPGQTVINKSSDPSTIVLCHNPDTADEAIWGQYKGWILCGHTHGGQCKPPFLPPPLLPVKNRRYTSGAFSLSGNRRMYISRGVGHLLQVRFNCRPEIPVFRLQAST